MRQVHLSSSHRLVFLHVQWDKCIATRQPPVTCPPSLARGRPSVAEWSPDSEAPHRRRLRRRRGTRRRRPERRRPEEARPAPHVARARTDPLRTGDHRTGAAPVHRGGQQRGASVQPRPASLGLRVLQGCEQLLRLRHAQRRRGHHVPDRPAPDLLRRRPGVRSGPGSRRDAAGRQGAGRAPRPPGSCTTPARAASQTTTARAGIPSSRSAPAASDAATRTATSTSRGWPPTSSRHPCGRSRSS